MHRFDIVSGIARSGSTSCHANALTAPVAGVKLDEENADLQVRVVVGHVQFVNQKHAQPLLLRRKLNSDSRRSCAQPKTLKEVVEVESSKSSIYDLTASVLYLLVQHLLANVHQVAYRQQQRIRCSVVVTIRAKATQRVYMLFLQDQKRGQNFH